MNHKISRLIRERRILRIIPDPALEAKEVRGAEYDLRRARLSLKNEDFKWATIQAYYAMFHAARALLYKAGYREKSHTALRIALRETYAKSGIFDEGILQAFEDAMDLREAADYGLEFAESSAEQVVSDAAKMLRAARQILRSR